MLIDRERTPMNPLLDEILIKIETGKKYYPIMKEHPKLSKVAKFGYEMF